MSYDEAQVIVSMIGGAALVVVVLAIIGGIRDAWITERRGR